MLLLGNSKHPMCGRPRGRPSLIHCPPRHQPLGGQAWKLLSENEKTTRLGIAHLVMDGLLGRTGPGSWTNEEAGLSQLRWVSVSCRDHQPRLWLYFRFPLSLRHVDELLATRGVVVSHETVRRWTLKFGQSFANQIRRRLPAAGDKWHLDEVAVKIAGVQH